MSYHGMEVMKEPWEILVWISGVLIEIQTDNSPVTSQIRYHGNNLLRSHILFNVHVNPFVMT
jgi:hypothetical protein